jgi:hypothetical protein
MTQAEKKLLGSLGNTPKARGAKLGKILRCIYDVYGEKENLIDVLTDLRHLADNKGWNFAECDRIAHDHYSVEKVDRSLAIDKAEFTKPKTDVIQLMVEQYVHDKNLADE